MYSSVNYVKKLSEIKYASIIFKLLNMKKLLSFLELPPQVNVINCNVESEGRNIKQSLHF